MAGGGDDVVVAVAVLAGDYSGGIVANLYGRYLGMFN